MRLILYFSILSLFKLPCIANADENLVIVQSISTTKKSFLVQRGMKDGIFQGQISLFGTNRVSFSAISIEVNRNYSVWTPQDPHATVPFQKGEIITYTNSIDEIWNKIPYLKIQKFQQSFADAYKRSFADTWISLRASFGQALYETISDVNSNDRSPRSGYDFSIAWGKIWREKYEGKIALRYDQDVTQSKDLTLSIPTKRILLLAKILFHLSPSLDSPTHWYGGLYAGGGQSTTSVNEEDKTGYAYILPGIEFGIETRLSKTEALFFALSGEGIFTNETFSDGDTQDSTTFYTKLSIGVKF